MIDKTEINVSHMTSKFGEQMSITSRRMVKRSSKLLRGQNQESGDENDLMNFKKNGCSNKMTSLIFRIYAISFFISCGTYLILDDLGLSTLLTVSAFLDFLAFLPLCINVLFRQNSAGISLKMLILESIARGFCLSSTLYFKGYLPADSTGSFLYQLLDVCSLFCLIFLVISAITYRTETQFYQDRLFPLKQALTICFFLAMIVHPTLNNNMVFDTFWTFGLYVTVVSMIPQLMVIKRVQDEMDGLSVNFVITILLSRMLKTSFWWHAYTELAPDNGDVNVQGLFVIISFFCQCFVMAGFGYYYCVAYNARQACYKNGGSIGTISTKISFGDYLRNLIMNLIPDGGSRLV